jgi:hypothetical protein
VREPVRQRKGCQLLAGQYDHLIHG